MSRRHSTWDTWLIALMSAVLAGLVVCAFWVSTDPGEASGSQRTYMEGAKASWEVINECERGSASCSAVLSRYNADLRPQGMRIFEDGSVSVIED